MIDLLCFGLGYSARAFARRLLARGAQVTGTTRTPARMAELARAGFSAVIFDGDGASPAVVERLATATHLLVSASPDDHGDPVLRWHADEIAAAPSLAWIAYLSTVGVYGDWQGGEVDETSVPRPIAERGRRRLAAEQAWLDLGRRTGKSVQVFRLAGIYGPGQNALENLRRGEAKRIIKPGQVFNRIHVDDIANTLEASIARPRNGGVYNVTDNEPAPPQDVVSFAAGLLGVPEPPGVAFEEAEMTPMARSFYSENKRVSNRLIREELGVRLLYPTYREGMRGLLAALSAPSKM